MKFSLPALAALILLPLAAAACSKAEETPAVAAASDAQIPLETDLPNPPAAPAETLSLDTLPSPAPGKWKLEAVMDGRSLPVSEVCYSEENLGSFADTPEGMTCSEQTVSRDGDSLKIHAVCTSADGKKTTMDNTVTGDLSTAYTTDMRMSFDPPPRPGMESMSMKATLTRLGDC